MPMFGEMKSLAIWGTMRLTASHGTALHQMVMQLRHRDQNRIRASLNSLYKMSRKRLTAT